MPAVLHIKPEEIDSVEKRSAYTVSVVGCDQKGILLAIAAADAGFKVVCIDADPIVLKKVAKGKAPLFEQNVEAKLKKHVATGKVDTSSDLKAIIPQSDIIFINVSPKLDSQNKADNQAVVNTCKQVGALFHQGALIVYSGVADFGFVEGILRDVLENTSGQRVGKDFGLTYHSTLMSSNWNENTSLKLGAIDQSSLNAATFFFNTISKSVDITTNVKVAEIALLFASARKDVNRALANELAVFCEKANIDYFEVLRLLNLNDQSLWPTVVGEENKTESYLLLDNAENLNAKLRLSALARQINEDMVKHAVNLTQEGLRGCGKILRRARVAILGADNTPLARDDFVKMLVAKGAKISIYDPKARKEQSNLRAVKNSLSDAVEGVDCIVILPGQESFNRLNLKKLKPLIRIPTVIVDLTGTLEPEKVRTEGFLYCGLGRGTG